MTRPGRKPATTHSRNEMGRSRRPQLPAAVLDLLEQIRAALKTEPPMILKVSDKERERQRWAAFDAALLPQIDKYDLPQLQRLAMLVRMEIARRPPAPKRAPHRPGVDPKRRERVHTIDQVLERLAGWSPDERRRFIAHTEDRSEDTIKRDLAAHKGKNR